MKKILVATDYSAPATNAVYYAAELAHHVTAELIIFNVFKLSTHASNSLASPEQFENLKSNNETRLADFSKEIQSRFEIQVRPEVGEDDTLESLSACTLKHSVDLVVMGIESSLIEYKLFGNTTTAAIKLLEFPILVVPSDIRFKNPEKIMFACDAENLDSSSRFGLLKQFVRDFNSKLEIFHVLSADSKESRDEAVERLVNQYLPDIVHGFKYERNGKVQEGIRTGLEQLQPDLLVMIPHKLGYLESLLKGSYTRQMTVETKIPLLILPNEKVSELQA